MRLDLDYDQTATAEENYGKLKQMFEKHGFNTICEMTLKDLYYWTSKFVLWSTNERLLILLTSIL